MPDMKNMGQQTKAIQLAVAFVVLVAVSAVRADAPRAEPSDELKIHHALQPSSTDTPQTRRLKLILASRVKLLAAEGEGFAAPAKAALLSIQQAALDSLSELANDKDPEVRQAAMDLLAKYSIQCRLTRLAAMLEPAQARNLLELQTRRPALTAQLVDDNMSARIAAIRKLATVEDASALREPLLAMCLWHSYGPLRAAAAQIVADKDYRSPEILDALTDIIVESIRRQRFTGSTDPSSPERHALQALYRRHPKEAAGKIFAAMRESRIFRGASHVDLLVQLDEKRLIPVLVAQVRSTRNRSAWESGWMFATLLRMTDQPLSDYGVEYTSFNPSMPEYGNYEIKDFDKTADKIAAWWEKNKDTPAYRDLKPLPIPRLPALEPEDQDMSQEIDLEDEEGGLGTVDASRNVPATGGAGDATATSGPSVDAALYDTAGLESQIRRLTTMGIGELRSDRPKERARARESIMGIEQTMLDALLQAKQAANREDSAAQVMPMLTAMASRCEMAARLAGMSDSDRAKLAKYARLHADIVEEFFSPVWKRQAQAVARMRSNTDLMGEAEPLVVLALKHPWPRIRNQAVEMTVGKSDTAPPPYRSDATVDALCDLLTLRLTAAQPRDTRFSARIYRGGDNEYVNEQRIVQALSQIKSKRAAPTLLAMMLARGNRGVRPIQCSDITMAAAMGATGEPRAIPLLCEMLQRPGTQAWTMNLGNQTIHFEDRDVAFYALLKLTGQDHGKYNMVFGNMGNNNKYMGFPNPDARKAAYEQFQKWWEANKDTPPYRDLKPLALPMTYSENLSRIGMVR
jgi:hypothetical protein